MKTLLDLVCEILKKSFNKTSFGFKHNSYKAVNSNIKNNRSLSTFKKIVL